MVSLSKSLLCQNPLKAELWFLYITFTLNNIGAHLHYIKKNSSGKSLFVMS